MIHSLNQVRSYDTTLLFQHSKCIGSDRIFVKKSVEKPRLTHLHSKPQDILQTFEANSL